MSEWRFRKGKFGVEVETSPGLNAWLPLALFAGGVVMALVWIASMPTLQAKGEASCIEAGGTYDHDSETCLYSTRR